MDNIKLIPKFLFKYSGQNGNTKVCIYIGDLESNQIIVGEINKLDTNRKTVVISGLNDVLFLDNYLIINKNDIIDNLYIKGKPVELDTSVFLKLTNSIISLVIEKYNNECIKTLNNNYLSGTNSLIDITLPEHILKFLLWNIEKKKLKFDINNAVPTIMKYSIYFAYLGNNVGCEIDKLRPVLIWKQHINKNNDLDNSYFVFPITSKIPGKNYYYNVPIKINEVNNLIKINDGKRISIKRIFKPLIDVNTNRTYSLNITDIENVKTAIKIYFKL